jgi:hypothetical protein
MLLPVSQDSPTTAATMRRRLWALEGERLEARDAGLGANELFMADIEQDIATAREAYIGLAVTEIAQLRGQLSGRLIG